MVAAVVIWNAGTAANAVGADTSQPPTALVQVEVLQPRTVEDVLWLTGRVEPWEERTISAETTGPIHWQNIEEGQPVTQGEELVRIDTTPIQATHAQASARSNLATQELKRLENLREAGITSPQDVDRASTEGKLAAADLAAANTKLNRSVLYAPIDGIVDSVYVEEKEFVDIGTALFKVVQTDRVKALIAVPERDIAHFKNGDSVEILVDALDAATFTGTIHRIATSAERATRTFVTEVAVDNAEGRLKPGMTIRARLIRDRFENAIAVPLFSVVSLENQHFVMVENGGKAEVKPIVVGRVQGDQVHVLEGLALGDRLIVQGHRDLRGGEAVRVQDAAAE
jgi:membrane fusion protein (multidrug efflux system)